MAKIGIDYCEDINTRSWRFLMLGLAIYSVTLSVLQGLN